MNISSISNFSYKSLNFKGNNTTNPIEENKESQQNNGLEVKITPEAYMAMYVGSAFDKLEDQGVMFENEDGIMEIPSQFDMTSEDFDEVEFAVDMALSSIKTGASMMVQADIDKKLIPTFVKFDYKNYISAFEKDIEGAKIAIENMDLPDIDDLPDFDEMLDSDEEITPEFIAQTVLANLPNTIAMQEKMLEKFKTTKSDEVKKMLEELTAATNSMLFRVIQHGFEGNARAVVADLSGNHELYNEPDVVDNEDGTLTYTYTTMLGSKYEVIRDKENGDYIGAAQFDAVGKTGFSVDFNKDGSIQNLDYVNSIDKSLVKISQENNRVLVRQIFNNVVTERQFVKNGNNHLKLTFANIYTM